MGLIKKSRIEDTGILVLEEKKGDRDIEAPEQVEVANNIHEDEEKSQQDDYDNYANQIIEQAKSDSEQIKEQAKNEGLRQGKEEASARITEALETLNLAVKERKKIIKDAESEILRLALKVAEQVIHSEVSLHRDVCLNIVSEAISRISDREQIIIRVNKDDAEYIKKYKDRLSGIVDGVKSFSIIEDSQIEPGGCVIETNLGYVDARIPTKLAAIAEALEKVASNNNEH